MEEYYQVAVRRDVGNNLKFPSKCAYCLAPTTVPHHMIIKHKELKGYKLKVPYCERHASILRYLKVVHYASLCFALLVSVLLARYLHNHRVFVLGSIGFNYLVAGIIVLPIWLSLNFVLAIMVLRKFAAEASLDHDGAVQIVGVHANGFALQFHNETFGREFTQLNYSMIERQR
jgi:hypothetical protein